MRSVQKGFTLIELMIVVAIVGILASIAIPAYLDYTTRAQVTEGLTLASGFKAQMTEAYAESGTWPQSGTAAGIDHVAAGKYVEAVTVAAGVLRIEYGRQSNERISSSGANVLALSPGVTAGGEVLWLCGRAPSPTGVSIAWQGDPAAITTVPDRFLPSSCRSHVG